MTESLIYTVGIQEGCKKEAINKQLKSLASTKKCNKRLGADWYRTVPTDKCRRHCDDEVGKGNYYGETYKTCTMKCPAGMPDKQSFRDKGKF